MSTPNPPSLENSKTEDPTSQNQDEVTRSIDLDTLVENLPPNELEKLTESYEESGVPEDKEIETIFKQSNKIETQPEENDEEESEKKTDLDASMTHYISNISNAPTVRFHDTREDKRRDQNSVETKILNDEDGVELPTLVSYHYPNQKTSSNEKSCSKKPDEEVDDDGVPYDFIEFEPSNRLPLIFSINLQLQWIKKSLEIDAPQKIFQAKNVLLSQTAMSIEKASLALGILSDSATVLKSSLVDFFTDKANRLLNRSNSSESAHIGLETPWMEDPDPLLPPQSPQAQTEQSLVETKEEDQKKNTKP